MPDTFASQSAPAVSTAPDAAGTRIEAVDALRGFALLGILIVHMIEQYLAAPPPPPMETFGIFSTADRVVQAVDGLLFIGKFFPIFALLFGVSVVIQMGRPRRPAAVLAAAGDVPDAASGFAGRYVWRLLVLLGIGLAHHALYRGDILSIYALLGLPIVLMLRASDRVLLWSAAALALGGPRAVSLLAGAVLGVPPTMGPPDGQGMEAYYAAVRAGDLGTIAFLNLSEGFLTKMQFQMGLFGRGYQTLALFLIGMVLARRGWHESIAERRGQLQRAWKLGLAASLGAALMMALVGWLVGPPTSPTAITRVQAMAFLTGYDIFNLGIALAFTSSFLLSFLRPGGYRFLHRLAPVGRTALTVYVSQSVIGTWLLYGHGLGLLGRIGAATALLLALALFAMQVVIAQLWVARFRYGPIEWLWRSLTQLKVAPLRVRRLPASAS